MENFVAQVVVDTQRVGRVVAKIAVASTRRVSTEKGYDGCEG